MALKFIAPDAWENANRSKIMLVFTHKESGLGCQRTHQRGLDVEILARALSRSIYCGVRGSRKAFI